MVATGALMLLFGSHETSDAWADALPMWWLRVGPGLGHIKRLVIYLDNGPKNSGRRTQSLKRMVQFADWSGLEIRLVYYPPYHRKYNPIERCSLRSGTAVGRGAAGQPEGDSATGPAQELAEAAPAGQGAGRCRRRARP